MNLADTLTEDEQRMVAEIKALNQVIGDRSLRVEDIVRACITAGLREDLRIARIVAETLGVGGEA